LLLTPLKGPDQRTWALAQGAVAVGGFLAEGGAGSQRKNHVTVARIPGGAQVETDAPTMMPRGQLVLILRQPDFTTASRVVRAIDATLGAGSAKARDAGAIAVNIGKAWDGKVPLLVATLGAIEVEPDMIARWSSTRRPAPWSSAARSAAAGGHRLRRPVDHHRRTRVSQPGLSGGGTVVPHHHRRRRDRRRAQDGAGRGLGGRRRRRPQRPPVKPRDHRRPGPSCQPRLRRDRRAGPPRDHAPPPRAAEAPAASGQAARAFFLRQFSGTPERRARRRLLQRHVQGHARQRARRFHGRRRQIGMATS
jgi:hypothetical protein